MIERHGQNMLLISSCVHEYFSDNFAKMYVLLKFNRNVIYYILMILWKTNEIRSFICRFVSPQCLYLTAALSYILNMTIFAFS